MKPKKPLPQYDRPKQDLPQEIVSDVMSFIRQKFYADADPKRWFQDANYLKRCVVTWPAKWLNGRGVTLPADRYKAIVLDILMDVCRHGKTGVVKFWPGYLAKCVQDRFHHKGDDYYEEGKSLRTVLERTLGTLQVRPDTKRQDAVETLATLHSILVAKSRSQRPCKVPAKQLSLF